MMHISEIWSVSDKRIRDFLLSQEDVRSEGEYRFSCGACVLSLTPLPLRKVGRFSFPQTRVEFSGPEEQTKTVHRRFFLQFVSAGG